MLRRNGVILTMIAVVLTAWLSAGCARQGEASRNDGTDTTRVGGTTDQTGGMPSTTGGSWVQERQEIETRLSTTIRTLDTRIEQLTQQSADATGEAKENIDKQIDKFKSEREELTTSLRDLGQASQDDWQDVRNKVNESLTNLDTTLTDDDDNRTTPAGRDNTPGTDGTVRDTSR